MAALSGATSPRSTKPGRPPSASARKVVPGRGPPARDDAAQRGRVQPRRSKDHGGSVAAFLHGAWLNQDEVPATSRRSEGEIGSDQKFAEPVSLSSTTPANFPLPRTAARLGFDLLATRARRKQHSTECKRKVKS